VRSDRGPPLPGTRPGWLAAGTAAPLMFITMP
jgi:hypothetical protein